MDSNRKKKSRLNILADHLSKTHDAILDEFRTLAELDPIFSFTLLLTRKQFIDDIPRVIEVFCARLCSWPQKGTPEQQQLEHEFVKLHSRKRWEMGYNMYALVREWGHLNICLLKELDNFGSMHPDFPKVVLYEARQVWASLANDNIARSAVEYHNLLQIESSARLNHLKTLIENMHDVELMRGNNLRTATHDLRGSLSILTFSASLINDERLSREERNYYCNVLNNGIKSLQFMLDELMDMARLEAEKDPIVITSFDAGQILNEFCLTAKPLAEKRGLFLKTNGPRNFLIEGDRIKTCRIVQNLVLNSLKYTEKGGVSVTWEENNGNYFLVRVEDSGPGLKQSTCHSHGEGVGLSIVKRLCELLNARIEVESKPDCGTTFQIYFPIQYLSK